MTNKENMTTGVMTPEIFKKTFSVLFRCKHVFFMSACKMLVLPIR